jgi:hypothetical protein
MQATRERGNIQLSYSFLTSALDGRKWSASCPDRAVPHGKDPRHPLYRRLVSLRAGLYTKATGKIFCLCQGLNFKPKFYFSHSVGLVCLTDCVLTKKIGIFSFFLFSFYQFLPPHQGTATQSLGTTAVAYSLYYNELHRSLYCV